MAERNGRPRKMGGPHGGMMTGEKAKDFKGTIVKLTKYIGRYRWAVLAVMILP